MSCKCAKFHSFIRKGTIFTPNCWTKSSKNSGLMNLDSFLGNRVYHLPKSVSFNEKRPRKPDTNIQKRFEDMKSELPPGSFQPRK